MWRLVALFLVCTAPWWPLRKESGRSGLRSPKVRFGCWGIELLSVALWCGLRCGKGEGAVRGEEDVGGRRKTEFFLIIQGKRLRLPDPKQKNAGIR